MSSTLLELSILTSCPSLRSSSWNQKLPLMPSLLCRGGEDGGVGGVQGGRDQG